MDILKEIAIRCKDRIVLLDRDLLDRKVPVDMHKVFYERLKGRHYKHLKQGSGWSFAAKNFEEWIQSSASHNHEPIVQRAYEIQQNRRYEFDIPEQLRHQFASYHQRIFTPSS